MNRDLRIVLTWLVLIPCGLCIGLTAVDWIARKPWKPPAVRQIELPPPRMYCVNSAPWFVLTLVDGVGSAIAKRIVEEREAGGPFDDADDLARRVRGVGLPLAARIWEKMPPDQ